MLQNNRKAQFKSLWLTLWGKTVFVNNYPLLLVNCCLNKYKFSFEYAPFKHGKKNKLFEYFSARFGNSHF